MLKLPLNPNQTIHPNPGKLRVAACVKWKTVVYISVDWAMIVVLLLF